MVDKIMLIKIGGSSITNKSEEETLDPEALEWFANLIASSVNESFLSPKVPIDKSIQSSTKSKFIVVHGAGSFGHHSAKRYGLKCGKATLLEESQSCTDPPRTYDDTDIQYQMEGLSRTRHSVQKLNSFIVGALLKHGVNAVGISPGVSIVSLRAHGATKIKGNMLTNDCSREGMKLLCRSINQSLEAGLVPVIHGDACLMFDGERGGILGGDTLVEGITTLWEESTAINDKNIDQRTEKCIDKVVFITDVAGVFTSDPKSDKDAMLIRHLNVNCINGEVSIAATDEKAVTHLSSMPSFHASGSSHAHDVTGGLEVRSIIYHKNGAVICSQKLAHCTHHPGKT